jgi:HAD superfamily hydrolase (TIGR01509 family)
MPANANGRSWRPAAVLWDMDGTLVDTEPAWMAAEHALAEAYGRTWSVEQALALVGSDLLAAGETIRVQLALPLSTGRIVEWLLDRVTESVEREVLWRPGARELLDDLRAHQVPCALVTMSYRRFAQAALRALPEGTFAAVVTGDEVDLGKPHPEPYLRAAHLLGVTIRDCIAIEDSEPGVASAEAAGCRVLVVPHHVAVPPAAQPSPNRRTVPSLVGLMTCDLSVMFGSLTAGR